MGVVVRGREYKNRYRPETVDWLIGNVGDWQTLTLTCDFSVEKKFTQTAPLMIEGDGSELVLADGTEWSEYGFDVGDLITWSIRITTFNSSGNPTGGTPFTSTVTRTITLLQGDKIEIDTPFVTDYNMLPYNNGRVRIDQVIIWADKQPEAAKVTYGHLINSEADSTNLSSFIDGTLTEMLAENMDTLLGAQSMQLIGLQSGMSIRGALWRYIQKIGDYTYQYEFIIEFMISSFYEDLENFETLTPPSQVLGAESLTDNFLIIGYPEYNNPNTQIKNDLQETKRLGNTGWFNENYNGLDNDFNVLSVEYTDLISGQPVTRLSYGAETKVKAVISGIPNLANGVTKLGIGFILLPDDEDLYKTKNTPFQQNLFVNTAGGLSTGVFTPSAAPSPITYTGYTSVAGVTMNVKQVHFYIQGTNLVYEAIFSPTAGFANYIQALDETNRNYAIWVSAADASEETNEADRVSLLLDYNILGQYVPEIGEWPGLTIEFAEHPEDENGAQPAACGEFRVEDDLLAVIPFNVDITGEIPNRMEFVVEVENTSGTKYELQRFSVDLSVFPTDGAGVPQWNYDQTRGFKLEPGNNKNWVKVQRLPANDSGNSKGYIAYYGFKIRWEDWIARTGVPNDFFNAAAENNGFNNDWFQYLPVAGWDMQFTVNTYSTLNGQAVKYVNSQLFGFFDYDTNSQINVSWEIERESDNTALPVTVDPETGKPLGILLKNEPVRIKVLYTKVLGGNFGNFADYYGTICIEIDKGAGQFEFRQLSTVWGSESDNPLKPLAGETKTKKTLVSPTEILLECLVDPSLLQDAVRYKLSSRLGCLGGCQGAGDTQTNDDINILVFLDNSGSTGTSFKSLAYMRDSMLKDYLVPFYGGNESTFESNVLVQNVNSERTMQMVNFLGGIKPSGKLLVFVFQDEASPIYIDGAISPRTQAYDNDIAQLRDRLESFESGTFNASIMQLEGGGALFTEFLNAVTGGITPYDGENGLQDFPEVETYLTILEAKDPKYYVEQIVTALNNLGYTLNI